MSRRLFLAALILCLAAAAHADEAKTTPPAKPPEPPAAAPAPRCLAGFSWWVQGDQVVQQPCPAGYRAQQLNVGAPDPTGGSKTWTVTTAICCPESLFRAGPVIQSAATPPAGHPTPSDAPPNGLTPDGLEAGLGRHFIDHGLDGQSITISTPVQAVHDFLSYAVECALPKGAWARFSVGGAAAQFSGMLGLAPEWEKKACDMLCQQKVSACLLARTNAFGVHVQIDMRGADPALATTTADRERFTLEEGAFFGNIFAAKPTAYVCSGKMFDDAHAGWHEAQLVGRICAIPPSLARTGIASPPPSLCLMHSVGACHEACASADGSYATCFGPDMTVKPYPAITTFLAPAPAL